MPSSHTKVCKACGQAKPYDETQKPKTKASGFMGLVCWACYLVANAKIHARICATPEGRTKRNALNTKRRATLEGRAKHNEASKLANAKVRATPEGRAKHNEASLAWARNNPGKAAAKVMKRKAAQLQRTPSWADLQAIQATYEENAVLGLATDHEIPLLGKLVSGLHVHYNLQGLAKGPNSSKGNKMPNIPESWDYNPALDYFWRPFKILEVQNAC